MRPCGWIYSSGYFVGFAADSSITSANDRMIWWKRSVRSRAAIRSGTAPSMMAIVRALSFEGWLRSVVISRAMLRADGVFFGPAAADVAWASRRRRVVHSVTTRKDCLIALRKAARAFSIRCHRAATCKASGRPWVAAPRADCARDGGDGL